jgi:hypothetical protein
MATNPAGAAPAYGNFTNTPAAVESYTHRSDTTVNTPNASYTVAQLVALINAAVYAAGAVDSTGFGKASR